MLPPGTTEAHLGKSMAKESSGGKNQLNIQIGQKSKRSMRENRKFLA